MSIISLRYPPVGVAPSETNDLGRSMAPQKAVIGSEDHEKNHKSGERVQVCPRCCSSNISYRVCFARVDGKPRAAAWHCYACENVFDEVSVEWKETK